MSTMLFADSNINQAMNVQPSVLVSEEFLRSLRESVRREFRNEVGLRTTIVNDCLVCNQFPSPSCPICKGKYQLSLRKYDENNIGDSAKSGRITGFGEQFVKQPRVPLPTKHDDGILVSPSSSRPAPRGSPSVTQRPATASPQRALRRSNSSNSLDWGGGGGGQHSKKSAVNVGDLHEQILALRRQIIKHENEIENLNGSLDDATTNTFHWKQQYQAANAKLMATETKLSAAEDRIQELEDIIEELKANNAQLLERTRVSEACRTQSARALAKMRKETLIASGVSFDD